ncbi:hypothetical protein EW026_g8337 [Hermanssonia centrifuga]|uniref:Uncharacterized protein n=1 Tax=Hermanssonia centrifuga TaxID=98765 RepID=A0A4S4K8W0_9APHY|nr:hypothetical protein EW026_g8337 [Hermanssonia centrifuga]
MSSASARSSSQLSYTSLPSHQSPPESPAPPSEDEQTTPATPAPGHNPQDSMTLGLVNLNLNTMTGQESSIEEVAVAAKVQFDRIYDTLVAVNTRIDTVEHNVRAVGIQLATTAKDVSALDDKVSVVDDKVSVLDNKVIRLERKVDLGFKNIDEKFTKKFDELDTRFNERFNELDKKIDNIDEKSTKRFDELDKKIEILMDLLRSPNKNPSPRCSYSGSPRAGPSRHAGLNASASTLELARTTAQAAGDLADKVTGSSNLASRLYKKISKRKLAPSKSR